jgi:RNA polymerase sigma factor (sigma-70 family)
VSAADSHRTIDAIWRIEGAAVTARVARIVRDVGLAEELAQDALVAALRQWPAGGIPDNPGAWLTAAAKNRAIDAVRRDRRLAAKLALLGPELEAMQADAPDDNVGDDMLRLMFTACHPVLPQEARVALTLKLIGGLATGEIARAFLVSEATMAQRIVRAKRTLAEAHVPFETPAGAERAARLGAVLEAIYLVFNEGYAATAGDDWMRPQLCEEALRLGRILAGLAPDDAEVHGLAALMEIQASRLKARTAADGAPVLLPQQDRSRWDQLLIRRGLAALARADAVGRVPGPYQVQAAIAACHARAKSAADTDWASIAAFYEVLARIAPSPVVELNRAVAVGHAFGAAAGLHLADALQGEASLKAYHLLPAVRGDLLEKLGRHDEARAEFERAARLTQNARERELMLKRAAARTPPAP